MLRCRPCGRVERIGIERELEHVPWFRLHACELGVERFVGTGSGNWFVHLHQEIGDAAHSIVEEGHLVDHVEPVLPRGAYPLYPGGERLSRMSSRHFMDGTSLGPVFLQTFEFVLVSLLEQESSELAKVGELHFENSGFDALLQREVVLAVEPGGDLRGCEQMLGHRSPPGSVNIGPTLARGGDIFGRWAPERSVSNDLDRFTTT